MSQQSTSKDQSFNDDSSRQEPPQFYVMNQTEELGNEISDLTATVSEYTINEEEKANDLAIDPTKNVAMCVIVDGEHLSVNSCEGTQMEAVKSSDVNPVETLTDSTDVEPGEHNPTVMKDETKNGLTDDGPNNTTHIRVSNFSESMALPDLMKLLKPIGPSKKVYLARDRLGKGFALVNFRSPKSATKAIEMLNGQLYNDKMLKVEYSTPKTKQN